jgi:hypothetical protein
MRVQDLVRELSELPLRRNTLKAQRQKLGLSRAVLARILEVDPSSVYRQELRNPMSMLWHYALKGIMAEAKDRRGQATVRRHKVDLVRTDRLLGASRLDAVGLKYTAEKIRAATREQAKPQKKTLRKRWQSPPPAHEPVRTRRAMTKSEINAAVERAEARAAAGGKNRP